jgi:hypothetical protein
MPSKPVAVMQPYLFPYLGYFQLVSHVDEFIFFDDAQYIRRGFCNSNSILLNARAHKFSLPIKKSPQKTPINKIEVDLSRFESWYEKFLITLEHAYKSAPHFDNTYGLIKSVFDKHSNLLVDYSISSIEITSEALGINSKFSRSSQINYEKNQSAEKKILEICKELKAKRYVNMINGAHLYDAQKFENADLDLGFLSPTMNAYPQSSEEFVSHLSIIDMMMYLSQDEIHEHLNQYSIESKIAMA